MIEGKQINLRAVEKEDLPLLHKWRNDAEVAGFAFFSPHFTTSLAEIEKKFEEETEPGYEGPKKFVVETKDGKPIGSVDYRTPDMRNRSVPIGIMLGEKDYWSKGYGTDAILTLLDILFDQMDLRKASLWTLCFNDAAIRCAEKCGFKREVVHRKSAFLNGEYHDVVQMSLFKKDFIDIGMKDNR